MSKENTKHLEILSESELSSLYNQPQWNPSAQLEYFSLPSDVKQDLEKFTKHSRPYFILQWGYFRATHQFHFIDRNTMKDDMRFILTHCISNKIKLSELKSPSRPTLLKIKQHILKRFNYSEIDELKRKQLNIKALHLVKQHCKPKIIFKELIKHIERKRWVVPAYSVMQDVIGSAMSSEQKRLCNKLDRLLANNIKTRLDNLLTTEDEIYGITKLQGDAKNFTCTSRITNPELIRDVQA